MLKYVWSDATHWAKIHKKIYLLICGENLILTYLFYWYLVIENTNLDKLSAKCKFSHPKIAAKNYKNNLFSIFQVEITILKTIQRKSFKQNTFWFQCSLVVKIVTTQVNLIFMWLESLTL